jgi:hypothetical protein
MDGAAYFRVCDIAGSGFLSRSRAKYSSSPQPVLFLLPHKPTKDCILARGKYPTFIAQLGDNPVGCFEIRYENSSYLKPEVASFCVAAAIYIKVNATLGFEY